jgi:hypothetical protein
MQCGRLYISLVCLRTGVCGGFTEHGNETFSFTEAEKFYRVAFSISSALLLGVNLIGCYKRTKHEFGIQGWEILTRKWGLCNHNLPYPTHFQ